MNKQAHANSHTHCQAAQSPSSIQSLPKSVSAPTLTNRRTKKKYDCPTLAIRNAGESAELKVITLNKLTAKRKVKCLEIPHYA